MNASARVAPSPHFEPAEADPSAALFARYLKALALLCECQPYVDEPDFDAQIDALLRDACASYDIQMQHVGGRFEIALADAAMRRAACGS